MPKNKVSDSFRPYAAQIIFVDRGKGISAPNLQAAIEEIQERLATIDDHLHKGEGENSVKIGLDSFAHGDSSIALGHGAFTLDEAGRSVSLGAGSGAYGASSVAIGDGASALGAGAVAIGPGAFADADNIIVLGTTGHTVFIPGNLNVRNLNALGRITGSLTWISPSDDVIAEIETPIEVEWDSSDSPPFYTEKQLTLINPGRYRIKGVLSAEVGSRASLSIMEGDERIVDFLMTEGQENFSFDFYWDIGINTTITFRLDVAPVFSGGQLVADSGGASLSQIRICGNTNIGNGVIAW